MFGLKIRLVLIYILVLFLFSCKESKPPELHIFCGTTMADAMTKLADEFQKENKCSVEIIKGGTGNLLETIRLNKSGDLFLPGSDSYILQNKENEFLDTVCLGFNMASIMVQKGNPCKIASIEDLYNSKFRVVLSNENSGSIGKESEKILSKYGIYDKVIENAYKLTTDSKDLTRMLIKNEADIALNWSAIAQWGDNNYYLDIIKIEDKYCKKRPLILCRLKYSKNTELSKKFIEFSASEKGKMIFKEFGF